MIFQTQKHGDEVVAGAVRESALMGHQRATTSITIQSADAFSVFRCDTTVQTEI